MDSVSRLFPGPRNRRTTRVGIEHELLTRDSSTGLPVAIDRVRAATSDGPRVRTRRAGRAEPAVRPRAGRRPPAAGHPVDAPLRPGTGRDRPRPLPRRPPHSGRRAAPADLGAVRRHAGALRHHRPGRPPDDAVHRIDPGLPRLVARPRRPRAVAGAQPGWAATWPRRTPARSARTPGSRRGSPSTPTAPPSTTGSCAATTRWRRTRRSRGAPRPSPARTSTCPRCSRRCGPAAGTSRSGSSTSSRMPGSARSSRTLTSLMYDDAVRGRVLAELEPEAAAAGRAVARSGRR